MSYKSCKKCGSYSWDDKECNCKKYIVDHEDDDHIAWGKSPEDAAENYARKYDEEDHYLVGNTEYITLTDELGIVTKWRISAEHEINYTVEQVNNE